MLHYSVIAKTNMITCPGCYYPQFCFLYYLKSHPINHVHFIYNWCFIVGWFVVAVYTILPQHLQKLRASLDKQSTNEGDEEEEMEQDSEPSQLLRLMARHTQLEDLLYAHHTIGTHSKSFNYSVFSCHSPSCSFHSEMFSLIHFYKYVSLFFPHWCHQVGTTS